MESFVFKQQMLIRVDISSVTCDRVDKCPWGEGGLEIKM